MIFREADKNDIEALCALRLDYLRDDLGEISEGDEAAVKAQLSVYFSARLGREFHAFIAEEDGESCSCVFLLITEKPANPHFITGKTGSLLNVYTKPGFRRKGLAGRLVDMAVDCAKANGLSKIELSATRDGAPLYFKKGFVSCEDSPYLPMKLELL